jgi:hypothetical protein
VSRGGLEHPSRWGETRVACRSRIKCEVWCLFGSLLRGCCRKPKIITAMLIARPMTVIVKKSSIFFVFLLQRRVGKKPNPNYIGEWFWFLFVVFILFSRSFFVKLVAERGSLGQVFLCIFVHDSQIYWSNFMYIFL